MTLKTDGIFMDASRENGARERNRTANKQGGAPNRKENKKNPCDPELLKAASPKGNRCEQVGK